MRKSVDQFRWLTVRAVVVTAVLIGFVGVLGYGLDAVLGDRLPGQVTEVSVTVVLIGLTYITVYAGGYTLAKLEQETAITGHQKEVLYRFLQLSMIGGVLFIITVYVWSIQFENFLLGAGVASVLIAAAARKTLGSILSGLIIMSTDIFRVDDWVKVDDKFGQIRQISLFNTAIQSPQGELHIFPNDDLTTRDVTNLSNNRYRNDVLVGVDYDTDIDTALTVCDRALRDLTENRENDVDGFHPTSIKGFEESQITLAVKMWVDEPTPAVINHAQTTVLSELHQRFQDHEITIPYPQRTLNSRSGDNQSDQKLAQPESTQI